MALDRLEVMDGIEQAINKLNEALEDRDRMLEKAKSRIQELESALAIPSEHDLRKCPFCEEWKSVEHRENPEGQHQIICNFNKGGCGSGTGWENSERDAINRWNSAERRD